MRLIVASNNKGKIREIKDILSDGFEVLSLNDVGFTDDIEENGTTFEENAFIKVHAVAERFPDFAVIGDDSGLCVDALGQAPGVYSARYAGKHGNDKANIDKLLHELGDRTDRDARFVCCIAARLPDGEEFSCKGICNGSISRKPAGDNGFGYDPVFFVQSFGKTMAQLTESEKNGISHRGNALKAFSEEIKRRMK